MSYNVAQVIFSNNNFIPHAIAVASNIFNILKRKELDYKCINHILLIGMG